MYNWEQLTEVNADIRTTDIKGKDYAEVPERIKAFRKLEPNGSITTEIVSIADGVCVIKATVLDSEGKILGTGTAYEKEGSTFINKTSYIENAETSAVGRALGFCGFGIDTSVASFEEVTNAINNQKKTEPTKPTDERAVLFERIKSMLEIKQIDKKEFCKVHNLTKDSSIEDLQKAMRELMG